MLKQLSHSDILRTLFSLDVLALPLLEVHLVEDKIIIVSAFVGTYLNLLDMLDEVFPTIGT